MSRGTAASHAGLSIPYTNCRDTQGDRGGALVFAQASNDGSSCKQLTHIGSVALQLLSKCSPEFNCLRAFFDVSRISRISRISRSSVECPLLAALGSPIVQRGQSARTSQNRCRSIACDGPPVHSASLFHATGWRDDHRRLRGPRGTPRSDDEDLLDDGSGNRRARPVPVVCQHWCDCAARRQRRSIVSAARSSGLCRRRRHRELAIPRPQPGMWRRRVR